MGSWWKFTVGPMLDATMAWLTAVALAAIKALWGLLANSAFTSPDVTVLPQVAAITSKSQMVVNTGFILAIITAGITVMTHESIQVRYGIGDLAPRLVVGFVASNFSTPLCQNLIELANALTRALTGEGIGSQDAFGQLLRVTTSALTNPSNAFLLAIIGMIIAALTAMLLATWLVRIGVLIVLVGIAPVALACHATPFTDGAARLWWRAFLGLLATVGLQALALHTALDIFLRPDANLPDIGLPQDPTGTLNLFIVMCLLWTVVKIPGLMGRYVVGGGSRTNIAGLLVRMVLAQQLSGVFRIPRLGRSGRAAAAAAAGRSGAGRGGPSVSNTVIGYWRPRMPRPTPAATRSPAPAGSPAAGGPSVAPARPRIPAGVNPATAMPKTRPAWRGGRPAAPAGSPPAAPARPVVPPGVTPATAMPPTRPPWRTSAGVPPAGGISAALPRPTAPPGVTPATAMPRSKPAWRR